MKKYYYSDGTNQFGPVSLEELKEKGITRDTLVWYQDLSVWVKAETLEELSGYFAAIPPPLPKQEPPKPPPLPKEPSSQPKQEEEKRAPRYEPRAYGAPAQSNLIGTLRTYMIVIAVTLGIYTLLTRIGYDLYVSDPWDYDEANLILQIIAAPFLITYVVFFMMFIHKKWKHLLSLEGDYIDHVTPGKAVGFLFIPFFNFYWMFVVLVGFSRRLNMVYYKKKSEPERIPVGISMALSIAIVASFVLQFFPVIGDLLALGIVVLLLVYLSTVINAFKELEE